MPENFVSNSFCFITWLFSRNSDVLRESSPTKILSLSIVESMLCYHCPRIVLFILNQLPKFRDGPITRMGQTSRLTLGNLPISALPPSVSVLFLLSGVSVQCFFPSSFRRHSAAISACPVCRDSFPNGQAPPAVCLITWFASPSLS